MDAQIPNCNAYLKAWLQRIKNMAKTKRKGASPDSPTLQKLHRLDVPSPGFSDQLCNVLYGEDYVRCTPDLQDDDFVWLVNYLDKVRRRVVLPHSPLTPA